MTSKPTYVVKFQPSDHSWNLSGPVGANGSLLFGSARESASYARWHAKAKGGTIRIHDEHGALFKTIQVEGDASGEDGLVLPSV